MPMEISLVIPFVKLIGEWFSKYKADKKNNTEEYRNALVSFYTALNETKLYISKINKQRLSDSHKINEEEENRLCEEKLSRLWLDASIKLREINRDLADRCFLKSDYWTEPNRWSDADVKKAKIDITKVFKEARKLL